MNFDSLVLPDYILKALKEEGYTTPTPIQAQAIPMLLQGKDLLGVAQTGTGKTAAFSIPIIIKLAENRAHSAHKNIRALVVTPTRELAIQIDESIKSYGKYSGIKSLVIFGGVGQQPQTDALKRGADILIATPGRMLDLMQQGYITLKHLEYFVLDEADRMLDMGFIHDVRRIIAALPVQRQSLFFSATMPPEIQKLSQTILNKPAKVEVTPVSSTAETIQQYICFAERKQKPALLKYILDENKIPNLLVFTRTKHGADRVARQLMKQGIQAMSIHGDKSQQARQKALQGFKEKTLRVLVATDIAARGIDVDDLAWVVNYDIPNVPETYVHRIGRTGRAGASGTAISFCDLEERAYIKDIEKLTGVKIPVMDHPIPPVEESEPVSPQTNQASQQSRSIHQKSNDAPKKRNFYKKR